MKQPAQSERGPNAIPPCLNRLNDAPPYFIPPREGPRMPNAQAPPRPTAGFTKTQYMDTLPRPEPYLGLAFRQANLHNPWMERAWNISVCLSRRTYLAGATSEPTAGTSALSGDTEMDWLSLVRPSPAVSGRLICPRRTVAARGVSLSV